MKLTFIALALLVSSTSYSYAQNSVPDLSNFEPRFQTVLCAPYKTVVKLLTADGLKQKVLFAARGAIVDTVIDFQNDTDPLSMNSIAGIYQVWTNQDSGLAAMTFTDKGGHTCIQASMTEFTPYTGD